MMEEHFRKGKYVPLQTGQIPGLESKVILIDGAQLAELMFDYGVGVSTVNSYAVKRIDSDFFSEEDEPLGLAEKAAK